MIILYYAKWQHNTYSLQIKHNKSSEKSTTQSSTKRKKFGPQKTRIMGLPGSEDSLTIG